jgi:hypothetical protein
VEVALHVADERDLAGVRQMPGNVRRVVVYRNGKPMSDAPLAAAARAVLPDLPIGGGTVANFTELNRNRPAAGAFDALAFSITPQVHATDDLSAMENLSAQADIVRAAKALAGGVRVLVGPVTLHRRPDPFAAGNDGRPIEAPTDPRHATDFGAAWTVGSLKYLAEAGADAVTYYEAFGPHGLMSDDGQPHPLFRVFEQLAEFAGGEVLAVNDPAPLKYLGFAVRKAGRTRLFLANTGWDEVVVPVGGHGDVALPINGVAILELEGA